MHFTQVPTPNSRLWFFIEIKTLVNIGWALGLLHTHLIPICCVYCAPCLPRFSENWTKIALCGMKYYIYILRLYNKKCDDYLDK